jgi:uncharacterized membrane protein
MGYAAPRAHLSGAPLFWFAFAFAIGIGGFWPSFFSQLTSTDLAHGIHGVSATVWMALPVVQYWLIRRRKLKLHRQLGWVALIALAPILVISGLHMVQLMVVRYQQTHAIRLLKFTLLDIGALTLFVVFLGLAARCIRRQDIDGHIRYMAGTVLLGLEPILERVFVYFVPGVPGFAEAAYYSLMTLEVLLVIMLYLEWRRGRIRLPLILALGFFVTMHVVMTPVATTETFAAFANWFAAI